MIGNDLIDLGIPLSANWDTSRYLNKLFTTSEQNYIFEAEDPELNLQLLWSLKEAAYKAHQRKFNLPRRYNPLDFSCDVISTTNANSEGTVTIENFVYHTTSSVAKDYIHSIAICNHNFDFISKIYEAEVALKKEFLLEYSVITGQDLQRLSIQKNAEQIPSIFRNKTKLPIDFSLSHHGKFSAFVLALRNS